MKCAHDWKKLAEVTLPSAYEQMGERDLGFTKLPGYNVFQKKYILVVFCKNCGKLKKFVEANP